jgi:hypothetical protein
MGDMLGLPEDTRARSKTWGFNRDPWEIKLNNGESALSIGGLRFTVVEIESPSVRTYCTLQMTNWLALGWHTIPGRDFEWDLEVKDIGGGILVVIPNARTVFCENNTSFNRTRCPFHKFAASYAAARL